MQTNTRNTRQLRLFDQSQEHRESPIHYHPPKKEVDVTITLTAENWLDGITRPYDKNNPREVSLKRKGPNIEKHMTFLDEVRRRGINVTDFKADTSAKSELLPKYYDRFRAGGSQPIGRYDKTRVGALFRKMVEYAKSLEQSAQ